MAAEAGAAAGGITPTGWLMAGASVLGSALSPSPAGPAVSSNYTDLVFDASGWTVATGKSRAESEYEKGADLQSWVLLGIVALVVVGWVKTRRR